MKKNKKVIRVILSALSTIITISISGHLSVEAKTFSSGRSFSSRSFSSRSVTRSSIPRVTRSTSKPSSIKSSTGKSTLKPTSSSSSKSTSSFSVKPKKSASPIKNTSFLNSYSRSNMFNLSDSFFKYYGIYHLFNDEDDVSERDIAEALAEKGYTESEINTILEEDVYKNNKKENDSESILFKHIVPIGIILLVVFGLFLFFRL